MFFFSSRRRHTRYWRDWSSDVCSSDLMATSIPPHNAAELCDAALYLISHPKATSEQLTNFVPGPDLPTGGVRSEECRVGEEGRSRWWPYYLKKKQTWYAHVSIS